MECWPDQASEFSDFFVAQIYAILFLSALLGTLLSISDFFPENAFLCVRDAWFQCWMDASALVQLCIDVSN